MNYDKEIKIFVKTNPDYYIKQFQKIGSSAKTEPSITNSKLTPSMIASRISASSSEKYRPTHFLRIAFTSRDHFFSTNACKPLPRRSDLTAHGHFGSQTPENL